MMNRTALTFVLTATLSVLHVGAATVFAQSPATADEPGRLSRRGADDEEGARGASAERALRKESSAAMEGLWPSQKLTRLMILRWSEEVGDQYDLSDEQLQRTQDIMVRRWTEYLGENRERIQPLVNEFIEMRMEMEPPGEDRVKEWASRALPAFKDLRGEFDNIAEEFREVLTPLQSAKLDREMMKMNMGMRMAENKLQQWKLGDFEEYEVWEATQEVRRERREQRERDRAAERGEMPPVEEEPDEISKEVDAWKRYAEDFIRGYDLDAGQADTARSILQELIERALAHRDSRRDDIMRLERRIAAGAKSDEEREAIRKDLVRLYGPVDEMFQELRRRLEAIPTSEQKARFDENTKRDREARREERRRRFEERRREREAAATADSASPSEE